MSGNGNGNAPLEFKSPNIPIIGQPFTIKGWFPTILLTCNCGKGEAVMIPRGAGGQCPACKRIFVIQAIVAPAGVQFGIGVTSPDGEAADDQSKERHDG